MTDSKNKTELVTFKCDPVKDRIIRIRATMNGKTKSSLYRKVINAYLNK